MKGISLPINAIVIVAIAVLVLVVIAAFFSGMLIPSSLEIQRETAVNKACQTWRLSFDCDPDNIEDATVAHTEPSDPSRTDPYNVEELCVLLGLAITPEEDNACRAKCNCPAIIP